MKHTGPDFIGIGSSRCGTSYIYKQLRNHKNVWMPPLKELHYFGEQRNGPRLNYWMKKYWPYAAYFTMQSTFPPTRKTFLDWRFLWLFMTGKRTDKWYGKLFKKYRGISLSGDITPNYAVLPVEEIKQIYKLYPDAKILLMMRDPISLWWSAACKFLGQKKNRNMQDVPKEEILDMMELPTPHQKADFCTIIENWESVYPTEQVFYGFLDEIKEDPEGFLLRLFTFLELPVSKFEKDIKKRVNDTSSYKSNIPPDINKILAEKYLPSVRKLESRFGEYPKRWRKKMEDSLTTG